ncbi:GIY-YIG nuclease family protein [Spirosoma sp. RP8]|uniref:GIY-YIG nuclease family protein n=1 Tax=Spirosoma liriopis TaxID=2937440 RepID=A0ABT0HJJ6_9BACT|nr:GIY-YIG nuclease family protein [Spirosoma liriopis]MCK8491765.1 GIY-YIG nuclease family protein [Spirosoma liriopis]
MHQLVAERYIVALYLYKALKQLERHIMNQHLGKSLRLYLVDGTPLGILTAEIMNWTGHVIMGPRTQLKELVLRPEMTRTGVYILSGPDPQISGKTLVYIGESDNVGRRLIQHNKDEKKDFWEQACVITSKDQNLTKAHVRYLESRLIALSHDAGYTSIHNGTAPDYNYLPEADIADMNYFMSQLRLVLPVLGYEFLRYKPQVLPVVKSEEKQNASETNYSLTSPIFIAKSAKHDLTAQAEEVGPDFIVLAGSEAQSRWIGKDDHTYKSLFDRLIDEGKLVVHTDKKKAIFQESTAFKSPSAASAIVFGRASNGRVEWKVKDTNQTYADWQNEKLANIEALIRDED